MSQIYFILKYFPYFCEDNQFDDPMKRNLAALLILGFFCFLSCGERETKLFNGKDLTGWTFHVSPSPASPSAI